MIHIQTSYGDEVAPISQPMCNWVCVQQRQQVSKVYLLFLGHTLVCHVPAIGT
jgi:hypothetical protein